jgi:UDP-N-acetylmuramoyl-tripeptide--D-alanyl-D-alanine ligase
MISLDDILNATEGRVLRPGAPEFTGISTDSRSIRPGELFVPLAGPHYDGHDYIMPAFESGALCALVQKDRTADIPGAGCLVEVANTLDALQAIASYIRNKHRATPVIGITGTNGKTTTKEMTASILGLKGPVLKNDGNLNNEIGLPLTLVRLETIHWAAVLEMGMSGPDEIARLAEIAGPDVGVITNIGAAHLETLGSVEAVAKAKAELIDALPYGGRAVLNNDDPMLAGLIARLGDRAVTFGRLAGGAFMAESISDGENGVSFNLNTPDGKVPVAIPIHGYHNVMNALAASAAAWTLGMTPEEMRSGLAKFKTVGMRMELLRIDGITVINDAYNANPASMAAALNTLSSFRDSRRMAVLGDMLELGDMARESHYNVGRLAGAQRLSLLVLIGEHAPDAARGAVDAGMDEKDIILAAGPEEAAKALGSRLSSGDCLLVKGSRGMRMERIIDELKTAGRGA